MEQQVVIVKAEVIVDIVGIIVTAVIIAVAAIVVVVCTIGQFKESSPFDKRARQNRRRKQIRSKWRGLDDRK